MAYNGYLIKLGGANGTILPVKYMKAESYSCTPDQRMEAQAYRDVTGALHRVTCTHTASKIEFETPYLTNTERAALNALLSAAFSNAQERKLVIQYYDDATDTYKEGTMYMPDVQYTIYKVDNTKKTVLYNPVRYAFIEY